MSDATLFDTISVPVRDQRTAPTPPASVVTGRENPEATAADRHREQRNAADLKWLAKADHWGEWKRYSETELGPPESVWMMRGSNGRVRFYAVGQGQVGAEHASVVAASCWAAANRYVDPDPGAILLSLAMRAEVLAGGVTDAPFPAPDAATLDAEREKHERALLADLKARYPDA